MVFLAMLLIGLMLGFIGAGGAGIVIAVLTVVFHIPIHTAFGTSLGAMVFTTLFGTYSHFKEGNAILKSGAVVGLFGGVGAFCGTQIAILLPAAHLKWMTGSILVLAVVILCFRLFGGADALFARLQIKPESRLHFWLSACGVGIVTGLLSGMFGVGTAPYIQIGLLVFFGMTLRQAAGTSMLVLLPIALLGGLGYLMAGLMNMTLFVQVAAGLMAGSFFGAKFTKRLPPAVLKFGMFIVPATGAALLFFG